MFKVGDVVRGNKGSDDHYGYTTSRAVCKVVKLLEGHDDILVEILEHESCPSRIGYQYEVESKYFDLVEKTVVLEVVW